MSHLSRRLQQVKVFGTQVPLPTNDSAPRLADDWLDFLAGFVTAEGSFGIWRNGNGLKARFCTRVRLDDYDLLQQLCTRTELGLLYKERGPQVGRSPAAIWYVLRRADLARLVELLDEHPPRGRKAREFAIWRRAALVYASDAPGTEIQLELRGLREELAKAREYRRPAG